MGEATGLELSTSDPQELRALETWLDLVPDVRAERLPGQPGDGEQGALDILSIVADSGVLIAAIRILPEFLRSRRSPMSVRMTVNGRDFEVTADNAQDVLPVLERLLDA